MYELQPLTIGEILDAAFTLYRRHFSIFLTIGALCVGPGAILQVYVALAGGNVIHPWASLLYLLVAFLGGLVASGATLRVISDLYLGNEVDVKASLAAAFSKVGPLMAAGLATGILVGLGFLLLFIPGVIAWSGYALAPQVVILEGVPSGTAALPRSWELTKGYRMKVLAVTIVISFLLWIPLVALNATLPTPAGEVLGVLASLLISPIYHSALTLLYYDLRVRKEGFDLELLGRLTAETAALA